MSTPYDQLVTQTAAAYGVPASIALAQMQAESGGNPNAVSSAGAIGLFQLMPGTAQDLGVFDPYDPVQNINGGLKYLRSLYDQFGSWDAALAAYHAGPGNYQAGVIGPATTSYVQKILSMIGLGPPGPFSSSAGPRWGLAMKRRAPAPPERQA